MKLKYILPLFFLIFSSCLSSDDSISNEPIDVEIFQWHLTNASGGIAGIDTDFEMDVVIWVFNVDSFGVGSLIVQNTNSEGTFEDGGLKTGVYPITIEQFGDNSILYVDGIESGGIENPTVEDLVIDQNITSSGTGADGFIYTFKRKVVTQTI